eukprot:c14883_g1_i1.p1 GENE.c14883_g1_i1~~c14883_g1_i1.p1  ORF type:complete len:1029 (+),score=254.05 c14883_g1_i1:85-3087(+)
MKANVHRDNKFVKLFVGLPPSKATPTVTVVVIDKSGSMNEAYRQVKQALEFLTPEEQSSFHFILYNDRAARVSLKEVQASQPGGGTSFSNAFDAVREELLCHVPANTRVQVIFMTDGQLINGENGDALVVGFREFVKDQGLRVTVHSLGFGSCNQPFLDNVSGMGSEAGLFRYASANESLEEAFKDVFALSSVNFGAHEVTLRLSALPDPISLTIDAMFSPTHACAVLHSVVALPSSATKLSHTPAPDEMAEVWVTLPENKQAEPLLLLVSVQPPDTSFQIQCVRASPISTAAELEAAQSLLNKVNVFKAPRSERAQLMAERAEVQADLNAYHSVFSEISRNNLDQASIAARLSAIRHTGTFKKARRVRDMDQRAQRNAKHFEKRRNEIESALEAMHLGLDASRFEAMGDQFTCSLSGDSIAEVMATSKDNFLGFAVQVVRPEHAVDAPSLVIMQSFLSGVYARDDMMLMAKYAIEAGEAAYGGFQDSRQRSLDESIGMFRGPDGMKMNGFLPLFIDEQHFARVKLQVEPLLGFFFTLDPLGYKGDQLIALHAILGSMLVQRANGAFVSEWADWLIEDFAKLCRGLHPLTMDYLRSGAFTSEVRGDLVEDFLRERRFRFKDMLQNPLVIVGWDYAHSAAPLAPILRTLLIEELWRRGFSTLFKHVPPTLPTDSLHALALRCPKRDAETLGNLTTPNDSDIDAKFAMWAKAKLGALSKANTARAVEPKCEGLQSSDVTFESLVVVDYSAEQDTLDAEVEKQLQSIATHVQFLAAYLGEGAVMRGAHLDGHTRWIMVTQAIRFHRNETARQTHQTEYPECLGLTEADAKKVLQVLVDRENENQKLNWNAIVEKRNAFIIAGRTLKAKSLDVFIGRLMACCPTRGGLAWDALVGMLKMGQVMGEPIPKLNEKIRVVLTGKLRTKADEPLKVLANGTAWTWCPLDVAEALREHVGRDQFENIEVDMYGTTGWVYRLSDLPNRHGHSNSHPNPLLTTKFAGFHLP